VKTKPKRASDVSSTDPLAEHPEDWCQRCCGRNVLWFAPDELWNRYHGRYNILCPDCFMFMAKLDGFDPVWELRPGQLSTESVDKELAHLEGIANKMKDKLRFMLEWSFAAAMIVGLFYLGYVLNHFLNKWW
jgi:hypothetical protein